MSVVPVGSDYDVVIESGCSTRVAEAVGDGVRRALVVHPDSMRTLGERVTASLRDTGIEAYAVGVPDAEAAKTAVVAADLWALLGRHGFTRTDVVVGVGGGTVTDLAGFVAATWLRGVPVVQVPTTLLGMVDAAVGGKTGINTAEGKNLVGSFHPPRAVLCDVDVLATLPRQDYVAGLAEIVKAGFIVDPVILDLVAADPEGGDASGGAAHARAHRARHPGQGRRREQGPQGVLAARDPQLRAHVRARHRAGRALPAAAR